MIGPMAVAVGARLGHYELISRLGAGGMGEVYRARDLRLGREVAVKVLPERVSSDPEALECLMPHDLSFERALLARRRLRTREEFRDALLKSWNRRWTLH